MTGPGKSCCLPTGQGGGESGDAARPPVVAAEVSPAEAPSSAVRPRADAVRIPGGLAEVGTDRPELPDDGEGPRRMLRVKPFAMDRTAVSNLRFAEFVAATGHVTEAERLGWSFVFHAFLGPDGATRGVVGTEWWRRVDGACWHRPEGPGTSVEGRADLPVIHVSLSDAEAFAVWAGGRLPGEAEWEHAARGGLSGFRFPWGDEEPDDTSHFPCNIWQGRFPEQDLGADGFAGLAPARSFEANGYGLYNMVGNTWEWTSEAFRVHSLRKAARAANDRARREGLRLIKGGSFLCHKSYCYRYRIASRTATPADSATGHLSFRLVYD